MCCTGAEEPLLSGSVCVQQLLRLVDLPQRERPAKRSVSGRALRLVAATPTPALAPLKAGQ